MEMEKSGDSNIPNVIKGSLARLHYNKSNLLLELRRLSKHYLFIGGAEHHDEHKPRSDVRLYDQRHACWVAAGLENKPYIVATRVAEIAICGALFGSLNRDDERAEAGSPLVGHHPPYYGWHRHVVLEEPSPSELTVHDFHHPDLRHEINPVEASRYYAQSSPKASLEIYATPQIINAAKLLGPALKGYVDIVDSVYFRDVRHLSSASNDLFSADCIVSSLATIEVDGTDLPSTVQPKNFLANGPRF